MRVDDTDALGVYIHLPFCPYICPYCDFAKELWQAPRAARYLNALAQELTTIPQRSASTLFLGGGTPNTFAPEQLSEFITSLRSHFSLDDAAEISMEVNPDLALCNAFAQYRAAGVNRLSIGVQSFVESEIRVLGRRHRPDDIDVVTARARNAGFDAISIDLMFGMPGQTRASLDRSLDALLALDVGHVALYGLTVEEDTPYATWRARSPELFDNDDLEAEFYDRIITRLEAHGYEHYELSNFARPGERCRHNMNYWENGEYLGLGVGAASYLDGVRSMRTKSLDAYINAIESAEVVPCESERLQGARRIGEAAMLALRRDQGIDAAAFSRRYGVDIFRAYRREIRAFERDGLIACDAVGVRLTRAGKFLANDVCAAFLTPTLAQAA